MERELKQALAGRNKQAAMDKLMELNKVEVPAALVDQEAEGLKRQMMQQMYTPQGKSGVDLDASMFREQAERRVTLGLVLSELIKSREIKVSEEQLRAKVEEIAATYEKPEEVVKWYYSDKKRLSEVESLALEDAVVDWVFAQGDVSEKMSSFDEVLGRA
jgi:trigger factor